MVNISRLKLLLIRAENPFSELLFDFVIYSWNSHEDKAYLDFFSKRQGADYAIGQKYS